MKFYLSIIFVSFIVAGCGKKRSLLKFSDGTNSGTTAIKVDLAWDSIKKNLFDTSCIKCHNPDIARRKARTDLTKKEVVLEYYDDIVYRMTEAFDIGVDYMPPKGGRVSSAVIKELKVWNSDIQFANLQKKIFEVSCLKCHGDNQIKYSNLSSKEVVIENFDEIIYKMTKAFDDNNKPMPPLGKGGKVEQELIKELQDWKLKRP